MSVNKAILVGHVGQDPEVRSTKDGREVANFSMATSTTWKDKASGESKSKAEWHKVVAFGGLVNIIKSYVKKGSKVYIEGKIQTREWKDKEGNKKYTTEIILQGFDSVLVMLDSKNDSNVSQNDTVPKKSIEEISYPEDDIPF